MMHWQLILGASTVSGKLNVTAGGAITDSGNVRCGRDHDIGGRCGEQHYFG